MMALWLSFTRTLNPGARSAFAGFFGAFSLLVMIPPASAAQLTAEATFGREEISSPLIHISPDGPLILVDGVNRLAGNIYRLALGGNVELEMGDGKNVSLSAHADTKQSPSTKDLDFSTLSADAILRKSFDGLSMGIGPSIQSYRIANSAFRTSLNLHTDFMKALPNGDFGSVLAEYSINKHAEQFQDLNSRQVNVSAIWHSKQPGFGFDGLDFQVSASREKNDKDFDELSYKSYYARASIDREMMGLTWSLGYSIQRSNYDRSFIDGLPAREDRFHSFEFSVERKLTEQLRWAFETVKSENDANLPLYQSQYRYFGLSLILEN